MVNYNANISYCTFANNQANTCIISLEESESALTRSSKIETVNMVDNIFANHGLMLVTNEDLVIQNSIFHNYNDQELFKLNGHGSIKVINSTLDTNKVSGYATQSCVIGDIDDYPTFDLAFYATHNCFTNIPTHINHLKNRTISLKYSKLHFWTRLIL